MKITQEILKEFGMKIGIIISNENELIYELSDLLHSNTNYCQPLKHCEYTENYEAAFEMTDKELDGLLSKYNAIYHFPKGYGYYPEIKFQNHDEN